MKNNLCFFQPASDPGSAAVGGGLLPAGSHNITILTVDGRAASIIRNSGILRSPVIRSEPLDSVEDNLIDRSISN